MGACLDLSEGVFQGTAFPTEHIGHLILREELICKFGLEGLDFEFKGADLARSGKLPHFLEKGRARITEEGGFNPTIPLNLLDRLGNRCGERFH